MDTTAKHNVLEILTLKEDSSFYIVVQSLLALFEYHLCNSKKLQIIFTEWKLHSKGKLPKRMPRAWKKIIKDVGVKKESRQKTLFCIETLLVILFKSILAIFSQKYKLSFSQISFASGKRSLSDIVESINLIDTHLLHSEPYERQFNWWFGPFAELINEKKVNERIRAHLEKMNNSMGNILLFLEEISLSQYIDIFGELYQHIIDRQIRKNLGEFYTPLSVVKIILDSVGYLKGNLLSKKRLLDPACGSGVFLKEALKRYISDVKEDAELLGWSQVLEELCNGSKILGLDINPFSCLMTKIRFALELLPYYKKALQEKPSFVPPKIPIFCSDFLTESGLDDNSFDYIVGNPPYVGVTEISKEKRETYQKKFKTAKGRLNLYILFIERSIDLLKFDGMLGFLLPTAFMVYSGYGRAIREYILEKCYIKKMINLALCESVFKQDVSVGVYIFQKTKTKKKIEPITSVVLKTNDLESLSSTLSTEKETQMGIVMRFPQSFFSLTQENIFSPFLGKKYYSIIKKMEDGRTILGDLFKIEQCIRIGSPETRKLVLINEEQYAFLSSLQQKRYRRIIDGLDLDRYKINWRHRYLKYEPETDYERLYLPKKPSIFERKKLFFRNTSKFLTVAYDGGNDSKSDQEKFFYALNTVYLLFLKDKYNNDNVDFTKYALAYLNSPLAEFYYRAMFWGLVVPGGSIKYREILRFLPFKLPETSTEENCIYEIVDSVNQILEANANESDIYNHHLKRIKTLLFALYDLNQFEIEQINRFLTDFCLSCPTEIKSKN
ncbi:MAG: Eco57I restriction-modification methylase domain-containing protein [Promethearchaeota archaeon]